MFETARILLDSQITSLSSDWTYSRNSQRAAALETKYRSTVLFHAAPPLDPVVPVFVIKHQLVVEHAPILESDSSLA